MSGDVKVQDKSIAYDLYKEFQGNTLEYTYRGEVDSAVVENILSLAESSFDDVKEQLLVRKKVYFVMVETLQNITRHQELHPESGLDRSGLFIMRRSSLAYSISTGNLIKNDQIEPLRQKIETVNSKDPEQLKDYAREVLKKGTFSSKGGAGLGLIEIARKSGCKLKYRFVPAKGGFSTFYMNAEIPIGGTKPGDLAAAGAQAMDSIQKYHKMLLAGGVVLNFSGKLNQTNLKNLLNILSRQIVTSKALKMKIYNVMIELLQNVLKNADRMEKESASSCFGMFSIRQDDYLIELTSANHVENTNIAGLSAMLKEISGSTRPERDEMAKREGFKGGNLVSIMNKSRHLFQYNFYKLSDKYSLFALSAYLNKESKKDITM